MKIAVLCGGVGAARLLRGFQSLAKSDSHLDVTAIVNTGDDDTFYDYYVCPDIDSILYHLSDLHDEERGWGRKDETFHFVETLRTLGIDAWFNLGDKDLALNELRTSLLRRGFSLREATRALAEQLDITNIDVVPMCDEKVSTIITTDENIELSMQEYFVRERCAPNIASIEYRGAPEYTHKDVRAALEQAEIIVVAPSNPFLSIHPLLAINEINEIMSERKDVVVAVSPIVGGQAVKGPLAEIMKNHSLDVSPVSVAQLYVDYVSTFIFDSLDSGHSSDIEELGMNPLTTNTMMTDDAATQNLASFIIENS